MRELGWFLSIFGRGVKARTEADGKIDGIGIIYIR